MSGKLLFVASSLLATALLNGQNPAGPPPPPPPIPGEEVPRALPVVPEDPDKGQPEAVDPPKVAPGDPTAAEEAADGPKLRAIQVPLGIRTAKPVVSTTEKLLRASETAMVAADTMWMTIDHARGQGTTTVDLDRSGLNFLIERKVIDGKVSPLVIRGGRGVPAQVREAMMIQARKKGVLYGVGRDRLVIGSGAQRMRLGVANDYGRSVHGSQSVPFDEFPKEVRDAATDLLEAARTLPVAKTAKGVVRAEFVHPQQARRLTILSGKRLIGVRDPGKEATQLPPAVAAARMPGRTIVVLDELEWEQIQSYLTAGGLEPGGAGQCMIAVGTQTYRLFAEPVGW